MNGYPIGVIFGIVLMTVLVMLVVDRPSKESVTLEQGQWYCSDARVDSLELPLVVECYEYKRKGVKNDNDK